jgi:drug/metabolite transporter (DMT)-like permease
MLRSSIVIYTAVFAMIFLGKKLYRHHWSSLVLMVFGIFLVGLASMTSTVGG